MRVVGPLCFSYYLSMTQAQNILLAGALLTLPALSYAADTGIRVVSIEPAVCEYRFQSVVTSGDRPQLAFNHKGRTIIVRPGDDLGDYVISEFSRKTESVYNGSINAYQDLAIARVQLTHQVSGRVLELEEGQDTPVGGHVAVLADLESARYGTVSEGQRIQRGDDAYQVKTISRSEVILNGRSGDTILAEIQPEEEQAIERSIEESKATRLAAEREAEEKRQIVLAAREFAEQEVREAQMRAAGRTVVNTRPQHRVEVRTRSILPPEWLYPPTLYMCGPRHPIEGRRYPDAISPTGCRVYTPAPLTARATTYRFPAIYGDELVIGPSGGHLRVTPRGSRRTVQIGF